MKRAFTLIELVIVIVVVGILAAAIIPRTRTNPVSEAAIDLLSKIRYTQHLAIVDDKYDSTNTTWFKNRWQIAFSANRYSIISDNNNTYALDTLDRVTEIKDVELQGLNAISLSNDCHGSIISFDYLGRPLVGSLSATTASYTSSGSAGQLLTNTCSIKLTDGSETAFIDIAPETGYASIR